MAGDTCLISAIQKAQRFLSTHFQSWLNLGFLLLYVGAYVDVISFDGLCYIR